MDSDFETKFRVFFEQISITSNSSIEDDTILQKLMTLLHKYLNNCNKSEEWYEHIGLLQFMCNSFLCRGTQLEGSSVAVLISTHCLSILVQDEETFCWISKHQAVNNFFEAIPYLRDNPSLNLNVLKIIGSLISHPPGFSFVVEKDFWKKCLIPSLKSRSIYVQKLAVDVVSNLVQKIKETQQLRNFVSDLDDLMFEFKSMDKSTCLGSNGSEAMMLKRYSDTVFVVFHSLFSKALGKKLYSHLLPFMELILRIPARFDAEFSSDVATKYCKLYFQSTLILFVKSFYEGETAEQKSGEVLFSEYFCLSRDMIRRGYEEEFLLASYDLNKYWSIMISNTESLDDVAELSKYEPFLYMVTKLQVIPFEAFVLKSSNGVSDEQLGTLESRDECDLNFSVPGDERGKNEIESLMKNKFSNNFKVTSIHCSANLASALSLINYFPQPCGKVIWNSLSGVLGTLTSSGASHLACSESFYILINDVLRALIKRFHVEWRKCLFPNHILMILCSVSSVPGVTARVKISSLLSMESCAKYFELPKDATTSYGSSNISEKEKCFDKIGEVLQLYLSDVDWEVRDSALELLLIFIQVKGDDSEFFSGWFLRFDMLNCAMLALGDVEPYVQASALKVLSAAAAVQGMLTNVDKEGLERKALRAALRSGEGVVRVAGLILYRTLFTTSRLNCDETENLVVPVVQGATTDEDVEVRLAALSFIQHHLNVELLKMDSENEKSKLNAVVDAMDPNICKDEAEVILQLITRFCANGYMKCVLNCVSNRSLSVTSLANEILDAVRSLITRNNLGVRLSSIVYSAASDSFAQRNTNSKCEEMFCENNSTNFSRSDEGESDEMSFVLDSTDLVFISRLKNEDSVSAGEFWWNDKSEIILKSEEIPPKCDPLPVALLTLELEAANRKLQQSINREFDNGAEDLSALIDDISLVIEPLQQQNESLERDCY